MTRATGISSHHRPRQGDRESWITPPNIIEALGLFDLDPCACEEQPFRTAAYMVAPPNDGLPLDWHGRVWLNPPYGLEISTWLRKLARHGDGIALIFARTDCAYWHDWVAPYASSLLFLDGRLRFHKPNGDQSRNNAGGPSVLIAYGSGCAIKLAKANQAGLLKGWLVDNQRSKSDD